MMNIMIIILDIKYARQVDELFDSMLSEVFGDESILFSTL